MKGGEWEKKRGLVCIQELSFFFLSELYAVEKFGCAASLC